MRNNPEHMVGGSSFRVFVSMLLALLLLTVLFQTLSASQNEEEAAPPNLGNSSKSADLAEAEPADMLNYTVELQNTGGDVAANVMLNDELPNELHYVANSLEVIPDIGLYGESGDVITWTGALNVSQKITLNFQAVITDQVMPGAIITNTATISTTDIFIERSAATLIVSDTGTTVFMPLIAKAPPAVALFHVAGPDADNEWTLLLEPTSIPGVTGYELQEANNPAFSGATLIQINDPDETTVTRSNSPSFSNSYYYRARSKAGDLHGPWSNVVRIIGNYYDDFSNVNSGWRTVREDNDDIDQLSFYSNGRYVHRQFGRWDYLLSSPVRPAPQGAYRLESRMRFVGQDNLHAYGLIFGGDWNGGSCPSVSQSNCFNHYYRLLAVWYGAPSELRIQLKRIDYNDSNNIGRGVSLVEFTDVSVASPPEDWQHWIIDVHADGQIVIRVNGNIVATARDTEYIDDRYFGAFSATNEYAGLRVELDWLAVSALD